MKNVLDKVTFKYISCGCIIFASLYLFSEALLWCFEMFILSSIIAIMATMLRIVVCIGIVIFAINGVKNNIIARVFIIQIVGLVIIFILCSYSPGWIVNCFDLEISG